MKKITLKINDVVEEDNIKYKCYEIASKQHCWWCDYERGYNVINNIQSCKYNCENESKNNVFKFLVRID